MTPCMLVQDVIHWMVVMWHDHRPDQNWPWDFLQAFGVLGGGGIALYQIGSFKNEQRKRSTIDVCSRYDFDPILNIALEKLKQARDSGTLEKDPTSIRFYGCIILNYLDAIAIGVKQGFYDKKIIREHLESIMKFHVEELLDPEIASEMGSDFKPSDWKAVIDLLNEWGLSEPQHREA